MVDGDARFPRLYVAASLKQGLSGAARLQASAFSAALCRGLIEATPAAPPSDSRQAGFPRLYVAASLKRDGRRGGYGGEGRVFRGFMSRPH